MPEKTHRRAGGICGGLELLLELLRRLVAEARMGPHRVVVDAPGLDDAPCLNERGEHVLVEALGACR